MVLNIEDRVQHIYKFSLDEISLKFVYFDTKQKLQYCCVLLVQVEVEILKVMTLNTHRFS